MRILQREAHRQQVFLIKIQDGAVEQFQAARIDEHFGAVDALEHLIGRTRCRVPVKHVAVAGAAAGLDRHAESAAGKAVLLQLSIDHACRAFRDLNNCLRSQSSIPAFNAQTARPAMSARSIGNYNSVLKRSA